MFTKLYEKIKEIIKENYLFIPFYFVLVAVCLYPLPFYIYNGGGTIDVTDRVEIENGYASRGSYNLCYVSELQATLPGYLLAKILPSWDIVPMEDLALNKEETEEDLMIRDQIYLNDANMNAIYLAYQKAGKEFKVTDVKNYVIYLDTYSKTDLKIGDDIRKVDGKEITNLSDLQTIVQEKNVGDILTFEVIRDGKNVTCTGEIIKQENNQLLGVALQTSYIYETNPEIELHFSENEAGPSGGLMLTLAIYDQLVPEDITKGRKIAGTGTIDYEGKAGPIGGVKYKLAGAVSDGADIFIVPNGENYEEAKKLQQEKNYDIEIIGVDTFEDALEKLG